MVRAFSVGFDDVVSCCMHGLCFLVDLPPTFNSSTTLILSGLQQLPVPVLSPSIAVMVLSVDPDLLLVRFVLPQFVAVSELYPPFSRSWKSACGDCPLRR